MWNIIGVGKITKKIDIEVKVKTVFKKKSGPKTYLLKDEESYIVEISEIDGSSGLPRDIVSLGNKLHQLLHDGGKQIVGNIIQNKSSKRYATESFKV